MLNQAFHCYAGYEERFRRTSRLMLRNALAGGELGLSLKRRRSTGLEGMSPDCEVATLRYEAHFPACDLLARVNDELETKTIRQRCGVALDADRICVCGHPRSAHEHYRRGTDCSLCPAGGCSRFRPDTWWRRPRLRR
jgi:hypothetical protein